MIRPMMSFACSLLVIKDSAYRNTCFNAMIFIFVLASRLNSIFTQEAIKKYMRQYYYGVL